MNQLEKRLKPFLRDAEVQKQLREACGSGYSNELIEYYWANREKQPSDRVSQYPSGQFEDCMEGPSSNSRSRSWDTGKRRSGKGRRTFGRCEENSVLSDDASDPAIIIEKTICFKPRATPRATPVEKSQKAVETATLETPTALRLEQNNIPSNNATQEVPVEDSLEFDNCSLILSAGEESNVGERKDKQKKKKRRKWLKEEELRAEGNARAPKGGAGEEGIASCLFRGRDCRTAEQKLCPGMKSVPRCRNALIRGLELMRDRNNAANQLGGPGEGFPPLLKTPEQFLQPASPISPKLLPSSQFLMDSTEFPPL
ncbi:hypothetical protein AAG570_005474 [Ranatra chinensis]|uniref:Uncharacterized protein n=1 Tax=Ranatra chinensis TaxID=642074 RepID=A0ABD0YJA1_9HEMI